jgi:hypothetical protein
MNKKIIKIWSIDEITLKLPLIDIKLKAPILNRGLHQPDVENMDLLRGTQGVKIALKAFNGSFVTAELNSNAELIANRSWVQAWEVFELIRLADHKIALRVCNGMFVSAKLHEYCQLVADRPSVQGWEAFTLHNLQDGKFALEAFNGSYVSADLNRNSELVADRPELKDWETFTLMLAD